MGLNKWLLASLFVALSLVQCHSAVVFGAQRPVIGIYAEPTKYTSYPPSRYSFIAASYAKYIESAGAQVVPIFYDADQAYYDQIFQNINGILFPGGDVDLVPTNVFTTNAAYLINKAIAANDKGDYFPVWGTCLGWELLNIVVADYADILSNVTDDEKVTHPINIVQKGRLFASMPDQLLQASQNQPLWFFNHHQCVTSQTYQEFAVLGSFFEILAFAQNDLGDQFVAAGEAKNYPIFGTQFHPEKNNWEWRVPANHDVEAVKGSEYFANFFVEECRKNTHQYLDTQALQSALIQNYPTAVIPPSECPYSNVYILPNWQQKHND